MAAACRNAPRCWRRASRGWSRCAAPRGPSASSRSCCSTFRPMPATSAPRPICRCSPRCINTLRGMKAAGYTVEVPDDRRCAARAASWAATRSASAPTPMSRRACRPTIMCAASAGCDEIEAQWGPAPGRAAERRRVAVRAGRAFRQCLRRHPAGLRLRRRPDAAAVREAASRRRMPSRAFYRWMREDFGADAVLHFGTHGALEFMPGKQAGLSASAGRTG